MAIVALTVAIIRLPTGDMRACYEFTFRFGVIFLFAIVLYDVNKWAGVFLLLALFSHSFPLFYMTKFKLIWTQESYLAMGWVVVGCGLYALIVLKCKRVEYLLAAVCAIGLLNVAFLVSQALKCDPYIIMGLRGGVDPPTGITTNPNEACTMSALCLPAFFRPKWWWLSSIILVGLVLSKSFGGMVGSAAAIVVFAGIHGYKFWPLTLILVGGMLYYRYVDQPNIDERLYIWGKSLTLCIANSPVMGFGLGNWKAIDKVLIECRQYNISCRGWSRLHSSFVQGYVEMGVGFLIVVAGYLRDIIQRCRANYRFSLRGVAMPLAALGSIAGVMTANSVFRMNAINAMIIVMWLAILEIRLRREGGVRYGKTICSESESV